MVKKSARYPHGKSIKNPQTYEALKRAHDKETAARISNAALNKGHKLGQHGRSRRGK